MKPLDSIDTPVSADSTKSTLNLRATLMLLDQRPIPLAAFLILFRLAPFFK
jgi:hypothetical protein